MITTRDFDNARVEAINRYEDYEKLANSCVDDEALYGFLKGFADASHIASRIIPDVGRSFNSEQCESLYESIRCYAGFKCTSPKGKDGDFLKNFRKGREVGCRAVIADLKMLDFRNRMEEAET